MARDFCPLISAFSCLFWKKMGTIGGASFLFSDPEESWKVKKWRQLVLHFYFLILRKAESKKMGTVGASFSFSDPEESWKWKNWHGFRRTIIESVVRKVPGSLDLKVPGSLDLKGLKSFFHLLYFIFKVYTFFSNNVLLHLLIQVMLQLKIKFSIFCHKVTNCNSRERWFS